jgi:hypothetical protein
MLKSTLASAALISFVSAQGTSYSQCGGTGWTGATTCQTGWTCVYSDPNYSQCLPASSTTQGPTTSATSTVTGISGSAPTTGPSKSTGQTPALGYISAFRLNISALQAFSKVGTLGMHINATYPRLKLPPQPIKWFLWVSKQQGISLLTLM